MAQMVGVFRIGRDAELRHTSNGDAVVSLSLAFNYGRKGTDGKRPSQWVEAALWGKRAEALVYYLTKGSSVYAVINDPHIETYDKKDGSGQGFKLTGQIAEIEFAGGSGNAEKDEPEQKPKPKAAKPSKAANFDDLDDDIPF